MKNGFICRNFKIINNDHISLAKKLRKQFHLNEIYFIIDNEYLFRMCQIALYPYRKISVRNKCDKLDINLSNYFNVEAIIESENKNNKADYSNVSFKVRKFIMDNFLFDENIIINNVSAKKYKHCLSVANLARNIAITNHYDSKLAYQAGLLHDIAKNMDSEELNCYMSFNSSSFEKEQPLPVLHQYVGEKYLKRYYKLNNKKVLLAIKHHCLGDNNDVLTKILYCADKLDPQRDYDSSFEINECLKDINQGYNIVVKMTGKYLIEKGVIQ